MAGLAGGVQCAHHSTSSVPCDGGDHVLHYRVLRPHNETRGCDSLLRGKGRGRGGGMHLRLQTPMLPTTLGRGVPALGEGREPEGADC